MDPLGAFKTIFCAYEVPTVRRVIESCSGHDTLFYNALKWARQNHYYLGELFGPQEHHFQYALTTSARFCDNIITVSERVKQELRFLEPQFDAVNIDPIYQGLSDGGLTPEQKLQSHTRLQQYIGNLLGFSPDYIFTHPTHLSTSQAHWRDLRILSHLAPQLDQVGRTAVYLVYSHGADAIRPAAISVDSRASKAATSARRVAHRDRHWALTHAEAELYCHLQDFNAHTQNIKAILVNALGWEAHQQDCCMPPDMTLSDLHQGTDLVFCQSIYEPFGPLLESAALGSLCVLSSVCGCNDLFDELMTTPPDHIIRADYTRINPQQLYRDAIFAMDQSHRDLIENQVAEQIARSILEQLPQNRGDMEKLIHQGRHLAQQVNWDNICRTFFLPAIDRAYHRRRDRQIA